MDLVLLHFELTVPTDLLHIHHERPKSHIGVCFEKKKNFENIIGRHQADKELVI